MRRVLIIFLVFGLVIAGVVLFVILSSQRVISKPSVVSERGKEFLKQQKLADNSLWRNVVLDQKTPGAGQKISLDTCFSLTVPFIIKHVVSEDGCSGTITLSNGGTIAIGRKPVGYSDLSESPDIKLRRSKPELYTEATVSASINQFVVFGRTDAGYERAAFLLKGDSYLTVSLVSPTNENLDKEYNALLQSIKLL